MKQPRLLPIAAVAVLLLAGPSASAQESQQSDSGSSQVAWDNNNALIQSRGPCDIVTYSAETQFPYVFVGIHGECVGSEGRMFQATSGVTDFPTQDNGPCGIVGFSVEDEFPYVYFGIHWECIGPTGPMSVSGMDGVNARLFMV